MHKTRRLSIPFEGVNGATERIYTNTNNSDEGLKLKQFETEPMPMLYGSTNHVGLTSN